MRTEDAPRADIVSMNDIPLGALVALNNAHEAETSFLDEARLAALMGEAVYAKGFGAVDAFLICFDQSADYDSPNFLWFRDRYEKFVYVDRIITAEHARGRGLARRLYQDAFEAAMAAGHDIVVCEVNLDPPNPGSDAFHQALGFSEVGRAAIHDGRKTVRYLARTLTD